MAAFVTCYSRNKFVSCMKAADFLKFCSRVASARYSICSVETQIMDGRIIPWSITIKVNPVKLSLGAPIEYYEDAPLLIRGFPPSHRSSAWKLESRSEIGRATIYRTSGIEFRGVFAVEGAPFDQFRNWSFKSCTVRILIIPLPGHAESRAPTPCALGLEQSTAWRIVYKYRLLL
jgi:hypothetical protein